VSTSSVYSNLPLSTQQALAGAGGKSSPLQITGLASGLNTQQIVQELVAIAGIPVTQLSQQQTALQALNTTLSSLQTGLQGLALNAQSLGDPGLFASSQSVSSANPSLVTAATTGGAPIGSYSVGVTQLANAAHRTFTFTSPSSADTVTVDGQTVNLAAGATANDFITAVNSNSSLDVYAASNSSGGVVLSSRSTGAQTGTYIQVSDTGGALAEDATKAYAGQDAMYSIDGVAGTASASDTIANAIPGVTLTLGGVTTTSGPVTVTVSPPGPSASSITSAVNSFLQTYNSVIGQVQTQLNTAPSTGTSNSSSLFGDPGFESLLSNMRTANYAAGAGLPAGMASLADIGITTGAASGGAPTSSATLSGQLQVNSTTLANAIATNPQGVAAVLRSWSQSFYNLVNTEAGPGGAIDGRIQGDSDEISQLGSQVDLQNNMLVLKQQMLTAQYAQLESTMSNIQSQGSWLTGQIASISANSIAAVGSKSG
jgi:flagellar hook-associated protein 2